MKKLYFLGLAAAILSSCTMEKQNNIVLEHEAQKQITVCVSDQETELYNLINQYRINKGLSKVQFSASLSFVAQTHANDQSLNGVNGKNCNLHSWSGNGDWTQCCYESGEQAECMWDKPKELTNYKGNGFEISYFTSGNFDIKRALQKWKESPSHNALLLNEDVWSSVEWNAIGVGIKDGYANVWFGEEKDGAGEPGNCLASK